MAKKFELRNQIQFELEEQMELRFSMMLEKGNTGFWAEIKRTQRDELSQWICIKDDNLRLRMGFCYLLVFGAKNVVIRQFS